MSRVVKALRRTFISGKFLGFCLLGILNTFNTAFFSWVGHYIMQDNLAAVFGYIVSLTLAFFLNCALIFKTSPSLRGYIKFLISYIPSFIIYFLMTFVTINTLELEQFWATVIAVAAGGPVTFVIVKLYAFGQSDPENPYRGKGQK